MVRGRGEAVCMEARVPFSLTSPVVCPVSLCANTNFSRPASFRGARGTACAEHTAQVEAQITYFLNLCLFPSLLLLQPSSERKVKKWLLKYERCQALSFRRRNGDTLFARLIAGGPCTRGLCNASKHAWSASGTPFTALDASHSTRRSKRLFRHAVWLDVFLDPSASAASSHLAFPSTFGPTPNKV